MRPFRAAICCLHAKLPLPSRQPTWRVGVCGHEGVEAALGAATDGSLWRGQRILGPDELPVLPQRGSILMRLSTQAQARWRKERSCAGWQQRAVPVGRIAALTTRRCLDASMPPCNVGVLTWKALPSKETASSTCSDRWAAAGPAGAWAASPRATKAAPYLPRTARCAQLLPLRRLPQPLLGSRRPRPGLAGGCTPLVDNSLLSATDGAPATSPTPCQ